MNPNNKVISYLSEIDPVLERIIKIVGPCILERRDPYQSLVRSIISQQLSVFAARTIQDRMLTLIGNKIESSRILKVSLEDYRGVMLIDGF